MGGDGSLRVQHAPLKMSNSVQGVEKSPPLGSPSCLLHQHETHFKPTPLLGQERPNPCDVSSPRGRWESRSAHSPSPGMLFLPHIAAADWETPGTARVNSPSQLLSSSGSAGRGIVLGKGHHRGGGGGTQKKKKKLINKASCLDLLPNFQSFRPEGHSNEGCQRCDWRQQAELGCPPGSPSSIPTDGTQCVLRPVLALCLPFPTGRALWLMWLCVFLCDFFFFSFFPPS